MSGGSEQGGSHAVHEIFGFGCGSDAALGLLASAGQRGRRSRASVWIRLRAAGV